MGETVNTLPCRNHKRKGIGRKAEPRCLWLVASWCPPLYAPLYLWVSKTPCVVFGTVWCLSCLPAFCAHKRSCWRHYAVSAVWQMTGVNEPRCRAVYSGTCRSLDSFSLFFSSAVKHRNAELDSSGHEALLASQIIWCGHLNSFKLHTHGCPLSPQPVTLECPPSPCAGPLAGSSSTW